MFYIINKQQQQQQQADNIEKREQCIAACIVAASNLSLRPPKCWPDLNQSWLHLVVYLGPHIRATTTAPLPHFTAMTHTHTNSRNKPTWCWCQARLEYYHYFYYYDFHILSVWNPYGAAVALIQITSAAISSGSSSKQLSAAAAAATAAKKINNFQPNIRIRICTHMCPLSAFTFSTVQCAVCSVQCAVLTLVAVNSQRLSGFDGGRRQLDILCKQRSAVAQWC